MLCFNHTECLILYNIWGLNIHFFRTSIKSMINYIQFLSISILHCIDEKIHFYDYHFSIKKNYYSFNFHFLAYYYLSKNPYFKKMHICIYIHFEKYILSDTKLLHFWKCMSLVKYTFKMYHHHPCNFYILFHWISPRVI